MKLFYQIVLFIASFLGISSARAQFNVTEIVTDFGGFWKSGVGSISNTKPNSSHNLLSFTYNNVRYSTGANDSLLRARNVSFNKAEFVALPMESITGTVNGNTKIGLGELFDGVSNGPSNPRPINSIPKYLQDGIHGLDIGTCVANLPAGTMNFPVTAAKPAAIGDGVPDLLITQTADPSVGSLDRYEFTDINGNRVGNAVDIVLANILPVGNWTADFYDANTNPMNLQPGFTKTDRPLRLWAADFSAFGINASNVSRIAYFRITLNGNSDVAFVAYNSNTIDVHGNLLPITMQAFIAKAQSDEVILNWKTSTEINSSKFVIEASSNGVTFSAKDSIAAAGNSYAVRNYQHNVKGLTPGKWYFRLRLVDQNGYTTYSSIQAVQLGNSTKGMKLYPNPASSFSMVQHPIATGNETLQLYNAAGLIVKSIRVNAGAAETQLNLQALSKGIYQVRYSGNSTIHSALLTIQ